MPIYVYQCDSCGVVFQHRQSFDEPPLTHCPECEGQIHRVIQPVGIVFKGSGFYVTDNRARSSTALPGESKSEKKEKVSPSPSNDSASKSESPAPSTAKDD